jgi:hypothetical protein
MVAASAPVTSSLHSLLAGAEILYQTLLRERLRVLPQGCASVAGGTLTHVRQEAAGGPLDFVPQPVAHFPQRSSQGGSDTAARPVPGCIRCRVRLSPIGLWNRFQGPGWAVHARDWNAPSVQRPQRALHSCIAGRSQADLLPHERVLEGGGWRLSSDWMSLLFRPVLSTLTLGPPGGPGTL